MTAILFIAETFEPQLPHCQLACWCLEPFRGLNLQLLIKAVAEPLVQCITFYRAIHPVVYVLCASDDSAAEARTAAARSPPQCGVHTVTVTLLPEAPT